MAIEWVNEKTTTLFWAGLVAGVVILIGGCLASYGNLIPSAISLLIIVSGLSIILGAFGATATINYQGVTMAGVAALCVILFYVVMGQIRNPSVRVDVSGFPRDSSVDFYSGSTHFLGALRGDHHDLYEFAVFQDDLRANVLGLAVTLPKQADGNVPADIIFGCIDKASITGWLGSQSSLQWTVDLRKNRLVTIDRQKSVLLSSLGDCPGEIAAAGSNSFAYSKLLPIGSALAATAVDLSARIQDLTAESSAIRTDARRTIGAEGPAAIKPLMDNWRKQPTAYRVRLGAVVSLVEMMRSMKAQKRTIGSELGNDDLLLLVQAATDADRTIRVYASEFLFDLADPRTAGVALQLISGASPDGQYNLALILTSVAAEMPPAERANLKQEVETLDMSRFGDRTRGKLGEI